MVVDKKINFLAIFSTFILLGLFFVVVSQIGEQGIEDTSQNMYFTNHNVSMSCSSFIFERPQYLLLVCEDSICSNGLLSCQRY